MKKGVSFILPCLNEVRTLGLVLARIGEVCNGPLKDREVEVIVADNGSTDGSQELARSWGARVEPCATRGYGAALKHGIGQAIHDIVIFADADNTYDFREAAQLVEALEQSGADFVLGSRFKGIIHPGAMPVLHQYLGTPVLNLLINLFHRRSQQGRITDCNSGFRCFLRSSFLKWRVVSDGMDFATEMVLKAFKCKAAIIEVPISLTPSPKDRVPHLITWQDGMKHLLRFFVETPWFFYFTGLVLFILGTSLLIPSYLIDVVQLGPWRIFGIHTTLVSNLLAGTGMQIWCFGAFVALKDHKGSLPVSPSYRWLIEIREDRLFWFICLFVVAVVGIFSYVYVVWRGHGFKLLELEDSLMAITFTITVLTSLVVNTLAIHVLKRI